MKLDKWLKNNNITTERFGKKVGVSRSQIHKYAHEGAIPRRQIMHKILEITQKEVTPNDFFDITLEVSNEPTQNPSKLKYEDYCDDKE